MPIQSITGKPGSAKTAFMVKRILEEAKKAERPLWAAGIDGLKPGLCNTFVDPREWNAVKPGETCTCSQYENESECTAHVIPNGSLIFIDEAWKWFGHLQDAQRQSTPKHVLQLAEHRHRGLDFVWTYQQPVQIFPFARGLMAEHRHLVRKFGTMYCDAYDWQELCEEVKNPARRAEAIRTTVAIPKETFGLYKSAEVHTIKAKIPTRVLLLPVVAIAAIAAIVFAINWLRPSKAKEHAGIVAQAEAVPGEAGAGQGPAKPEPPYKDADGYRKWLAPRIAAIPHTAKAYDGRPVVAEPELYCMKSGAGLDGEGHHTPASCTCITEQGTAYTIDALSCGVVAEQGPAYNPFKRPQQNDRESFRQGDAQRAQPLGAAPRAMQSSRQSGGSAAQVAAYGAFREGGAASW